jgi:hypothetical protein
MGKLNEKEVNNERIAEVSFNSPMGKLNSFAIYLLQYNNYLKKWKILLINF